MTQKHVTSRVLYVLIRNKQNCIDELLARTHRKAAIVEKDVSLLEFAKLSLFLVLLDGISNLVGGNLVLFTAQEEQESPKEQIHS